MKRDDQKRLEKYIKGCKNSVLSKRLALNNIQSVTLGSVTTIRNTE